MFVPEVSILGLTQIRGSVSILLSINPSIINIILWTNLNVNYVDRTVVRSNWFHYCIHLLLNKLLRTSQLIVIIILIVK